MKIHRFIGKFNLFEKELEINGEIAKQIVIVLKLKIGEKIELCDEKGISAMTEIIEINKKKVLVKILETKNTTEKQTVVNLFCAVLKKENFELVVQKTTECGISKIIPIITARTIKTGLNFERLKKIAKEASEQSGRTTMPEILETMTFEESLKLLNKEDSNILFNADGELTFEIHCAGWRTEHSKFSAENYARISKDNSLDAKTEKHPCISNSNFPNFNSLDNFQLSTFNLFVGPEGGWTPLEIEKVKSLNFKIASLGPLTLRGETAAIIATYLVSNLK